MLFVEAAAYEQKNHFLIHEPLVSDRDEIAARLQLSRQLPGKYCDHEQQRGC